MPGVDIAKFETEHFFTPYEFTVPHLLSCSDCETVSVAELLQLGGLGLEDLGALRLHYTEALGHPELRRAIAATYDGPSADEVMVFATPIEAIYVIMRALLEPADEVVVLSPCYDALFNVADHVCETVHRWPLHAGDGHWSMDLDALDRLLSSRTRLVVVNFPHNPTGFLPTEAEFARLIEVVEARGAWLFCDEMYRGLEFGAAPRLPSAVERSARAIVLSGMSKSYGLPGLRSGWVVARDPELRARLENWKYYTSICPPAPSEFLALAGLRAGPALLQRHCTTVRENVARAAGFFAEVAPPGAFTWRPPQAGSVALVEVAASVAPSTTKWCHQLARDPGVLLLPGTCLGAEDRFVRFGFGRVGMAAALEVLGTAVTR